MRPVTAHQLVRLFARLRLGALQFLDGGKDPSPMPAHLSRCSPCGRLTGVCEPLWGKYAGRIVARVVVDGEDLAEELIIAFATRA